METSNTSKMLLIDLSSLSREDLDKVSRMLMKRIYPIAIMEQKARGEKNENRTQTLKTQREYISKEIGKIRKYIQ